MSAGKCAAKQRAPGWCEQQPGWAVCALPGSPSPAGAGDGVQHPRGTGSWRMDGFGLLWEEVTGYVVRTLRFSIKCPKSQDDPPHGLYFA